MVYLALRTSARSTVTAAIDSAARPLTRSDAKTLILAALGGALEFYDFIIFVFFTTVIGQLFFPPDTPDWLRQLQAFGLFAAGYLARPLGGIVMAHFGDRNGRKRMFTLSVFLMAIPTLLIGLLPTYATLGYAAPLAPERAAACYVCQLAAIPGRYGNHLSQPRLACERSFACQGAVCARCAQPPLCAPSPVCPRAGLPISCLRQGSR